MSKSVVYFEDIILTKLFIDNQIFLSTISEYITLLHYMFLYWI